MTDTKTIIYVHHESALGGAPLSLLFLLRKLNRNRYTPHIICLKDGPAADLYRREGFSVEIIRGPDLSHTQLVWFPLLKSPRLVWRLLCSIPLYFRLKSAFRRLLKPDRTLVHLNSSTLAVAALAAKSLCLPIVWHIREPLSDGYVGFRKRCLGRLIRTLASQIVAISQHDAAQLGCASGDQLHVIHNFVDFQQFNRRMPGGTIRKELNIPADAPVLLFLGGSTRVKGFDILLKAFPLIHSQIPKIHLLLAGESDTTFDTHLEKLPSFRPHIHAMGPRQDVPALMIDSTLILFPSIVPHFARPVIEAAAMGRPAIASDLDGVRELVKKNETAILVPPGDAQALADAVVKLIHDPALQFRLGDQAFHWAFEKFDADKNAGATFQIYEKIFPPSPP